MKISQRLPVLAAAAVLLAGVSVSVWAQPQNNTAATAIGKKDIGGVVSSPHGRFVSPVEHRRHPVTASGEHPPAVLADPRPQHLVMAGQGRLH